MSVQLLRKCCCDDVCDTCQDGPATITFEDVLPCDDCYPASGGGDPAGRWSMTGSLDGTFELTKTGECTYTYAGAYSGLVLHYHGESPAADCSDPAECSTDTITISLGYGAGTWGVEVALQKTGGCGGQGMEVLAFTVAGIVLTGNYCGTGEGNNATNCLSRPIDLPLTGLTVEVGSGGTCFVTIPAD